MSRPRLDFDPGSLPIPQENPSPIAIGMETKVKALIEELRRLTEDGDLDYLFWAIERGYSAFSSIAWCVSHNHEWPPGGFDDFYEGDCEPEFPSRHFVVGEVPE